MGFRPDIKPPLWAFDGLEHVRYSILENAERMGIDPASIYKYMPLFEGGGIPRDIMAGISLDQTEADWGWGSQGLDLSTGRAKTEDFGTGNHNKVTIWGTVILNSLRKQAVFEKDAVNTDFGAGFAASSNGIRIYIRSTGADFETTETPNVGVPYSFCCTVDLTAASNNDKCQILINGQHPGYAHRDTIVATDFAGSSAPLYLGQGELFANYSWPTIDGQLTHIGLSYDYYGPDIGMALTDAPYALIQPVSQPFIFDLGGGSGPTYTETITTAVAAITDATAQQQYVDLMTTLITSGASATDTAAMVESIITLAQSETTASSVQDYVDTVGTTATATDQIDDDQQYAEDISDSATSSSTVTDQLLSLLAESLTTTATSASAVNEAQSYVETVTTLAQSSTTVEQLGEAIENIGIVATSISDVSEQQQYFQAVATVAVSSGSVEAVQAFIDEVASTASSTTSVLDVLVATGWLFEPLELSSTLTTSIELQSEFANELQLSSPLRQFTN